MSRWRCPTTGKKQSEIRTDTVIAYLETLPPESVHCAELAVGALYRALANYQDMKRNPWKKNYYRKRKFNL